MKLYKFISIAIAGLFLAACTEYQPFFSLNPLHSSGVGYIDEDVQNGLYKIRYLFRYDATDEKATSFLMKHIAELGAEKHMAYFNIYQSISDAANDIKSETPMIDRQTLTDTTAYAYVSFQTSKTNGSFSVSQTLEKYKSIR